MFSSLNIFAALISKNQVLLRYYTNRLQGSRRIIQTHGTGGEVDVFMRVVDVVIGAGKHLVSFALFRAMLAGEVETSFAIWLELREINIFLIRVEVKFLKCTPKLGFYEF